MKHNDRFFHRADGTRYLPLGEFGCYFSLAYVGEELAADSQHGSKLIEFQHATRSVWQKFFRFLSEEDGATAIRMFPRGDSGGSAWEGLDIGGRVNRPLFEKIRAYMADAKPYGIGLQLCLFTEPECSFYCEPYTRTYWGTRLWTKEEIAAASPAQRRFLEHPDDIVSYDRFFSDPDVRECCHRFLDELLPMLQDIDGLFAVEIFNEAGWASPHADPMNTFRWEDTPDYLDWLRDMTDHIRRVAPDLPVCISNPGVGLLGHDPIHWAREIRPDFYSLHNYPDICGSRPGMDYAAITDMTVQYIAAACPVMMGEWEAIPLRAVDSPEKETLLTLLSRDMAWMTLLSGAPGCISWCARGWGQYFAVREVFRALEEDPLVPDPPLSIDISDEQAWLEALWHGGETRCRYPAWRWCPDASATDGLHRFCVKSESEAYRRLLNAEQWSLECGIPFRFVWEDPDGRAIRLAELTKADFLAQQPAVMPIAGYRQKAFTADCGRVRLVYLQNYRPYSHSVDDRAGGLAEQFSLRRRTPVPVTITPGDADPGCRAEVYDLDTGTVTDLDGGSLDLGVTDHDFVVLLRNPGGTKNRPGNSPDPLANRGKA